MALPSYSGYRFPRDIIQRAVWMYLRFTLSYRDVEELLAERGIEVSYESARRWVLKFDPAFALRDPFRKFDERSSGRCPTVFISVARLVMGVR